MSSKQKKYLQISNDIYKKYVLHQKDHQIIPSENNLSIYYNVSRTTIRKAIAELVSNGVIYTLPGNGSYVASSKTVHTFEFIHSFREIGEKSGLPFHTVVKKFQIESATLEQAEKLQIPEGSQIYYTERIRYIDNKVFCFEVGYIPVYLFSDLSIDILSHSFYHYVSNTKGLKISDHNIEILSVVPRDHIADVIGVERDTSIVVTNLVSQLITGQMFEYMEIYKNPKQHSYMIHIKR